MSRLIEALRKAEEAKRKEQAEQDANSSSELSIQMDDSSSASSGAPQHTEDQQLQTEPQQQASEDNDLVEFELESIEENTEGDNSVGEPELTAELAAETTTELPVTQETDLALEMEPVDTGLDETSEAPTGETFEPFAADNDSNRPSVQGTEDLSQRHLDDERNRRQTDSLQIEPKPEDDDSAPAKKSKTLLLLMLLFITIVLIGLTAYFFFLQNTANQNQYPSTYNLNRGYLDGSSPSGNVASNTTSQDLVVDQAKDLTESPIEQTLLGTAQNMVRSTVNTISENTSETLSAVSALIEPPQPEEQPENTQTDSTEVFNIKRAKSLEGQTSSLSYALDNAQAGEHEAARLEYLELLRNQPTNRQALVGLANLEAKSGDKEAARQRYAQLLQLNPADPVAQLGLLENTNHQDPIAYEAELKTLASTHPSAAFISFKLGNFLASQNRWSEARTAFRQALNASSQQTGNPVNPDYAFNLAIALEKTQQPMLALEKYKQAKLLSRSSTFSFDAEVLDNRIEQLSGGQ